ncbi:hypothetical protein V6N13_025662 [Hibiscus sabdariffa]
MGLGQSKGLGRTMVGSQKALSLVPKTPLDGGGQVDMGVGFGSYGDRDFDDGDNDHHVGIGAAVVPCWRNKGGG